MGRSLHDDFLRPTPDQDRATERSPRQISRDDREQDSKSRLPESRPTQFGNWRQGNLCPWVKQEQLSRSWRQLVGYCVSPI